MANKHTEKLQEVSQELSTIGDHVSVEERVHLLENVIDILKSTCAVDAYNVEDVAADAEDPDAYTELAGHHLFLQSMDFAKKSEMEECFYQKLAESAGDMPSYLTASASWPLKQLTNG